MKSISIKILKSYIFFLIIFIISNLNCFSFEYFDTKGRDFWLSFIPNSHKNPYPTSTDSIFIFISSDKITSGLIEYHDRAGNYYKQNFSITTPNSLFTFKLQYYNYELWGYKTENDLEKRYQSETISKMAFHITCSDEITVYAHSQARQTSDAFLVLPTDVLDKNYILASFNSDGNKTASTSGNGPTPSEFAIIGTEDSTSIIIIPKTATRYNGKSNQKIMLNRGEVYLVQAEITNNNLYSDLTGTRVDADKPIAVFSGHQKSLIPSSPSITTGSRDCLIEQMLPKKVWSNNAFITPFKQPINVTASYNDLYRIIAAYDSTIIKIDNLQVAILNSGEFYQNYLTKPAVVSSNSPFMLVKYKKTSEYSGGTNNGDPFMLVVPPKEQYMNSYTTINVQAWETSKVYVEQYITIVIPTISISSFRLDGSPVNQTQFSVIPGSDYSYANLGVSDGVHKTYADSAFGIYIYGYGTANSFGYTGGMSFSPIDYLAPQIYSMDSCYHSYGMVYDSLVSDKGILKCYSPISSQKNCIPFIGKISDNGKSLSFSASLIDKRNDGSFEIIAIDSLNHTNSKVIDIKGFTLAINGKELTDELLILDERVRTGTDKCFKIPIHNYGKFNQVLVGYKLKNNINFFVSGSFPRTIKPNQIDTLIVCFNSDVDSLFTDTLFVMSECEEILGLANLTIETGQDRLKPIFTSLADSCYRNFYFSITDSGGWNSGIKEIEIINSKNCNISIIKDNPYIAKINIEVINTSEDMYYTIIIIDSAGYATTISDTIYAKSIKISGKINDSKPYGILDFGTVKVGNLTDDSISIINYGNAQITIDNLKMYNNQYFSIPQSQFPIIIDPNDSVKIRICFMPVKAGEEPYLDTLELDANCFKQIIILQGYGDSKEYSGLSDCDTKLKMISTSVPLTLFISDIYPNPSIYRIKFIIDNEKSRTYQIFIYDLNGRPVFQSEMKNLPIGIYDYELSTSELNDGIYFLGLIYDEGIVIRTFVNGVN